MTVAVVSVTEIGSGWAEKCRSGRVYALTGDHAEHDVGGEEVGERGADH